MDLTNSLDLRQNQTHSLELSTAIKAIEPAKAITAIKDALLRLSKLYQIQNFDASNALLLAEWVAKEFKHKPLKLIIDTLDHPPVTFDRGQVDRNWRLTPDTVYAWVDKRAIEAEELRQLQRTRQEQAKLLSGNEMSSNTKEMIGAYMKQLQEGMFKKKSLGEPSPEVKRIDLLLKLINEYKKENVDPITGKLYEDAPREEVWLFEKGYEIVDGNIKEI